MRRRGPDPRFPEPDAVVTRPGNQELAPEELSKLLGGELPSTLPLEGWRTVTLHCQIDVIGPSDRHPDLVKLEVSFPPAADSGRPCEACRRSGAVPSTARWDDRRAVPRPECSAS